MLCCEGLNKYLNGLGLRAEVDGSRWGFTDVFGFDPELLAIIPRPVVALTLLFPLSKALPTPASSSPLPSPTSLTSLAIEGHEERAQSELESQKAAGKAGVPDGVFFMRQYIGNACGTIAIGSLSHSPLSHFSPATGTGAVHAVANNEERMSLEEGGVFQRFLQKAKTVPPEKRSEVGWS